MVGFPPKSSIWIGFSIIIKSSIWGTPIFGNTQMLLVILRDFPYKDAEFFWVLGIDLCFFWGFNLINGLTSFFNNRNQGEDIKFLTLDVFLMVVRHHLISIVFLAYDTNDHKRFVTICSNGWLGKCCAQMSTRHFLINFGCQRFLFCHFLYVSPRCSRECLPRETPGTRKDRKGNIIKKGQAGPGSFQKLDFQYCTVGSGFFGWMLEGLWIDCSFFKI